jgi:hypothetical protein
MIPVDDGLPCTCVCHKGQSIYHMILKPCCMDPIQGKIPMKVFEIDDNLVIGKDREDAEKKYQDFLDS